MKARVETRTPFSAADSIISPQKRSNRIYHHKLPNDFFGEQMKRPKYQQPVACTVLCRLSEIRTPATSRAPLQECSESGFASKFSRSRNFSKISNPRETYTAHQNVEDDRDMGLIRGIIQKNRQMRRILRKHSVELRKQENNSQFIPFVLNRKRKQQDYFQLPPLLLRKGITTPC